MDFKKLFYLMTLIYVFKIKLNFIYMINHDPKNQNNEQRELIILDFD